jgi:aryl-alcohol dehydrogenase-like predicted oxidoreductase
LVPYYPLAGGFLTGKYERNAPLPSNSRFGRAPQRSKYLSEENFDRLERWTGFARAHDRSVGELAVAWLLAHAAVCSVIAGATAPDQMTANAKASEWALSSSDVADL